MRGGLYIFGLTTEIRGYTYHGLGNDSNEQQPQCLTAQGGYPQNELL